MPHQNNDWDAKQPEQVGDANDLVPSPDSLEPDPAAELTDNCTQLAVSTTDESDETTVGSSREVSKTLSEPRQLAYSTLLSLIVVLVLLGAVRVIIPPMVESIRYSWYRGQLRAEYEMSGQRLQSVSLDSLADVSQLVSQRVGPSVVHINSLQAPSDTRHPFQLLEGQGSGFVVSADGYILTNFHVIDTDSELRVTLSDGQQLTAEVVGVDPATDLALLKVPANNLLPVEWGNSDQVVVGSPVWAVGSPFGLRQTVTFGIISGKHRIDLSGTRYESTVRASTAYGDLMQSDVALNPGNSGGPLVDSTGKVIGVNAAILGESYRGISFSIPSNVAHRVFDQLLASGEVQRGWLGIQMSELAESERYDDEGHVRPGVLVQGFPRVGESPARQAGIRVGDIIVGFNDKQVMNRNELLRFIGESEIGSTVKLQILREGKVSPVDVILSRRTIE